MSFRLGERDLQGVSDLLRNFILDIKNIFHQTIEPFGPKVITVSNIDELGCDADLITRFSNTALEDIIHAQSFTYLPGVNFLVTEWKDVCPRDNFQFLNL